MRLHNLTALARRDYGTADAIAVSGTPLARFQQRFKETRLLDILSPGVQAAKRRRFRLSDLYLLRVIETLAGPGRLEVKPAIEIVRALLFHDAAACGVTDLHGNPVPPDDLSAAPDLHRNYPPAWLEEWQHREGGEGDFWVVAREYPFGWRVQSGRDVANLLQRLPNPDGDEPPAGSFAVALNLTAELRRVDAVLSSDLSNSAEDE